jgi:hypothetical protein
LLLAPVPDIDGQDLRAFLSKSERRRSAIPDPVSGALASRNDHGDFAFETHRNPP